MNKIKFIKNELEQLDIQKNSEAYIYIFEQASEAAEILSRKELKQLIQDHAESFSFAQCGH